jgi:hypothetical protein
VDLGEEQKAKPTQLCLIHNPQVHFELAPPYGIDIVQHQQSLLLAFDQQIFMKISLFYQLVNFSPALRGFGFQDLVLLHQTDQLLLQQPLLHSAALFAFFVVEAQIGIVFLDCLASLPLEFELLRKCFDAQL